MDDSLKKRLGIGAGEVILVLLIAMEIVEFMGLLTVDLNYIEKVLSWIALGYLLYTINLTEIFFGYKDKLIDLGLIAAYFLLAMKDFIVLFKSAMEQVANAGSSFLVPLYSYILDHAFLMQVITFYVGGGIIILLALLNIFLNADIKAPSVMAIIHGEGQVETISGRIYRALTSFLLYSVFFVVVFNLVIEWLGWALDSTLAVLAIFFYLFFFIKHYRRLDSDSFLYKVGEFGEDFYVKFINMFRSKETFLLGISGLLVLHLLTDVGNFIVPYTLGRKIDYFVALGAGHTGIPSLLAIDLEIAATIFSKLSVFLVYILNITAMLFMLAGPAFIWYEIYKQKRIDIPNTVYGIFAASIFVLLASPVFKIQRISAEGLYGVDILTKTAEVLRSEIIIITAFILLALFTALAYNRTINLLIRYLFVFAIELFFVNYIYLFFIDIASFYAKSLIFVGDYFILFYLFIFMAITIFFYLGGMIYFIYDTVVDMTKKFI